MSANAVGLLLDGAIQTQVLGNVISGNINDGLQIINQDTVASLASSETVETTLTGNGGGDTVSGNAIGTNFEGDLNLGNGGDGILLADGGGDLIGPNPVGRQGGNIIGDNDGDGINITSDSGYGQTAGDQIVGNSIGIDLTTDPYFENTGSLGNSGNGIALLDTVSGVIIGGSTSNPGSNASTVANTIAGNGGDGVLVGSTAAGNTIRQNTIDDNAYLAIDLNAAINGSTDDAGDGVTNNQASGTDTNNPTAVIGGNDLLNHPIISSANTLGVSGTYTGAPNTTVVLDFYDSPSAAEEGDGEGHTYVGSDTVTVGPDGVVGFSANEMLTQYAYVSATATDPATGNTSEFSEAAMVQAGPTLGTLAVADASVQDGTSGTSNLVFTVTLSAASTFATTVGYATSDGTATGGADYTSTTGTLTIGAGLTTGTITVPVAGEDIYQASKTLTLTLSNPTNATIATNTATGTIVYTAPEPTLSIANAYDFASTSAATQMVMTVTLSGPSGYTTTVPYSTTDGTGRGRHRLHRRQRHAHVLAGRDDADDYRPGRGPARVWAKQNVPAGSGRRHQRHRRPVIRHGPDLQRRPPPHRQHRKCIGNRCHNRRHDHGIYRDAVGQNAAAGLFPGLVRRRHGGEWRRLQLYSGNGDDSRRRHQRHHRREHHRP